MLIIHCAEINVAIKGLIGSNMVGDACTEVDFRRRVYPEVERWTNPDISRDSSSVTVTITLQITWLEAPFLSIFRPFLCYLCVLMDFSATVCFRLVVNSRGCYDLGL